MSYRTPRDVRYRVIDREAVILRQDAGETLVLNEVGARVLQLLADGASVDGAIDALLDEYEVERDALASDVSGFVRELVASGVLEPVAGDAGG